MNVKPIPNSLLGDDFYHYVPTESGWSRQLIENDFLQHPRCFRADNLV